MKLKPSAINSFGKATDSADCFGLNEWISKEGRVVLHEISVWDALARILLPEFSSEIANKGLGKLHVRFRVMQHGHSCRKQEHAHIHLNSSLMRRTLEAPNRRITAFPAVKPNPLLQEVVSGPFDKVGKVFAWKEMFAGSQRNFEAGPATSCLDSSHRGLPKQRSRGNSSNPDLADEFLDYNSVGTTMLSLVSDASFRDFSADAYYPFDQVERRILFWLSHQ